MAPAFFLGGGAQRRVVTGGASGVWLPVAICGCKGAHGGLTSFGLIVVVWRGKDPLARCRTVSRWLRHCPWEGGETVGRVRVFVLCFLGQMAGNT